MNKFVSITLFFLLFAGVGMATPETTQQFDDSTLNMYGDSLKNMLGYQSDYLNNAEVEHQKLLRNIFIIGFVFMLAMLVFTIIFYGNKIKNVGKVINMQNEALVSTKDQLIKIISVFNHFDRQVYITDSKGFIEWHNTFASKWFAENYEAQKISLLTKFSNENQGVVFQGINEVKSVDFYDKIFGEENTWKMVPIKNSKDEFANMVFIGF